MTQRIQDVVAERHPSIQQARYWFAYDHLPLPLQVMSKLFHDLAVRLIQTLNDGPELATALRKLREAKDCAVTQKVIDDSPIG